MINTLFLKPNLITTPVNRKIRLSGTAPNKRHYHKSKNHTEYWMNNTLDDEEYQSIQKYLSIDNKDPLEHLQYDAQFKVERTYRTKSTLDAYFFYLKNRTIQRAFSAHYQAHDDAILSRVDRRNCFADIAQKLHFPNPHHLHITMNDNAQFDVLLNNNISGLLLANITQKPEFTELLQKYHPFKTQCFDQYQTFLWRNESLHVLISKEEYRVYQQYMNIEPIWLLTSSQSVEHPLKTPIQQWQSIRENTDGIINQFAKCAILSFVSYGSQHYKKHVNIAFDEKLDYAELFQSNNLPSSYHHFLSIQPEAEYFSIKHIDLHHPNSFFMWPNLIQAAATADMFEHIAHIWKIGGIVHYTNVDSLHYSLPKGVTYTFSPNWRIDDTNIEEAIWFTAGRWATRKKDQFQYTGFPQSGHETLIIEHKDGHQYMWNAFNVPFQRKWREHPHYIEWVTLPIQSLETVNADKIHEYRRRFMKKLKIKFDEFKQK